MKVSRSAISDALIALVQSANYPFTQVSKHYQHWDAQDTSSWPVAYVRHIGEEVKHLNYAQPQYYVHYRIFAYALVNAADPVFDVDDQVTNPLLDALDAVFTPVGGQKITLGLQPVDECFIEGPIFIADGVEDGRAVYVVPVVVVTI